MNVFRKVSPGSINDLFHAFLILLSMAGLFGLLGLLLFGVPGIFWAVIAAGVIMAFTPRISPAMILRTYHARPLSFDEAPQLYRILSELSRRADLQILPMLHHVPTGSMNAFSLGSRTNSAIALSDGLIRRLGLREITGVLAHEISHIRSNDLKLHALADMMARITSLFSFIGQVLIISYLPMTLFSDVRIPFFIILLLVSAPSISMLLRLALSRAREFTADANAVRLTGDPKGLASALRKMDTAEKGVWSMFMLPGRKNPDPSILRTHPDTKDRVERLMRLEERSEDIFGLFDRAASIREPFPGTPRGLGGPPFRPRS